jgi:amidophosphoribosyltransferase
LVDGSKDRSFKKKEKEEMKKTCLMLKSGYGIRDLLSEECGLAAAINLPNASWIAGQLVTAIEKRGEKGSGVVSRRDRHLFERRRIGAFSVQFGNFDAKRFRSELPGRTAIAHCRYATQGDPGLVANVQPLTVLDSAYGPLAIAHNGTLVNVGGIRRELLKKGAAFQSSSDTSILLHLILASGKKTIEEAILSALERVVCAYSLLIITRDKVFAIRDRYGVRPLAIARAGDGFLVSSETVAFDQFSEAEFLREVLPGEMIIFKRRAKEFKSVVYARDAESFCIFEGVYFSNPRSCHNGIRHEDFRRQIGAQIVLENPELKGDLVVPILDSGKNFAEGLARSLAKRSGIPYEDLYEEVFQRSHGSLGGQARSFTATTTEERIRIVRKKLNLKKEVVIGKEVIVVDDSIVRSNTAKVIVAMLRSAGAKKVIFCSGFPPIVDICPYGMDFQTRTQLIAYRRSQEAIRKEIAADELIYIKLEGLRKVVSETYRGGICEGCIGGHYPVISSDISK